MTPEGYVAFQFFRWKTRAPKCSQRQSKVEEVAEKQSQPNKDAPQVPNPGDSTSVSKHLPSLQSDPTGSWYPTRCWILIMTTVMWKTQGYKMSMAAGSSPSLGKGL